MVAGGVQARPACVNISLIFALPMTTYLGTLAACVRRAGGFPHAVGRLHRHKTHASAGTQSWNYMRRSTWKRPSTVTEDSTMMSETSRITNKRLGGGSSWIKGDCVHAYAGI